MNDNLNADLSIRDSNIFPFLTMVERACECPQIPKTHAEFLHLIGDCYIENEDWIDWEVSGTHTVTLKATRDANMRTVEVKMSYPRELDKIMKIIMEFAADYSITRMI